jgi:hypothetical protein
MVRHWQLSFFIIALSALGLLAWSGPTLAQLVPRVPDNNALTILVRNTISALNQANRTGNYTVFRDLGSANFRNGNTPARLAGIFAKLRKRNLDFSPIVLFNPQFKTKPIIDKTGMLRMAGEFPTKPLSVQIDLAYEWASGRWLLYGIWVGTKPAAVTATTKLITRCSPSRP